MEKNPVVIYHAECLDGMSGGYAAWKKFGSRATYIPSRHQNPIPSEVDGRVVYIVDFSFPVPLMQELIRRAERVIAIDHHRMAKPSAELAHETIFSNDHSGATLAWTYFHPKKAIPLFLKHVEDVDLWRFKMKDTRDVVTLAQTIPHEFKAWDAFVKKFERAPERKKILLKANAMSEYESALLKRILTKATKIEWDGKEYMAVNSSLFSSELGHELSKMSPSKIGVVWYRSPEGIKVSLRSEGSIDTTEISRRYGGGGHRNASAFKLMESDQLPWKVVS